MEAAEAEAEEAAEQADDDMGTFQTSSGVDVNVSRARDYQAKALSLEEAVIQLDMMEDREFFVFTNAETDTICIIYRRADGQFGLIET